jgi:hypothetical protein
MYAQFRNLGKLLFIFAAIFRMTETFRRKDLVAGFFRKQSQLQQQRSSQHQQGLFLNSSFLQGCQMVYFSNQKSFFSMEFVGIFYGHLAYFKAILYLGW